MEPDELRGKWRNMGLLAAAELLVMCTWFSASAVVPALAQAWNLGDGGRAWLTMSVQIGFVGGSLGSALLNLADRIPARVLFPISAFLAAVFTALITILPGGLGAAVGLRILTGAALSGVYPVGMKIMATWTRADRGLGIGMLVGALTLGSAAPHLLNALAGVGDWRVVLGGAAALAGVGGLIAAVFVREGPFGAASPRFRWQYALDTWRVRALRLANLGYLGHMWELYAMWTWIAAFLLSSFQLEGIPAKWASLAAFCTISLGGASSLLAGKLADRFGRTAVSVACMAASGLCALCVGAFYGGDALLLTAVCLVWGLTIIPDSGQFSAAVSELCDTAFLGTALTLQTSLGFLLTMVSIRLVPLLVSWVGWKWAFAFLAPGPFLGIWAMLALRGMAEATKMAGGKR